MHLYTLNEIADICNCEINDVENFLKEKDLICYNPYQECWSLDHRNAQLEEYNKADDQGDIDTGWTIKVILGLDTIYQAHEIILNRGNDGFIHFNCNPDEFIEDWLNGITEHSTHIIEYDYTVYHAKPTDTQIIVTLYLMKHYEGE